MSLTVDSSGNFRLLGSTYGEPSMNERLAALSSARREPVTFREAILGLPGREDRVANLRRLVDERLGRTEEEPSTIMGQIAQFLGLKR